VTTLRRYIFAFFAVCAAFAGGIALGNGPLQGDETTGGRVSLSTANAELSDTVTALRDQQAFSQALSGVAGRPLLHGQLANTTVAIVVLPGVAQSTVAGVTQAVKVAGGEVSVLAHVSSGLVDPGRKTYVDSVATNSLKGLEDLASATDLSPYGRIGALLGRAYAGPSDDLAVDAEATRIDAQLQGAKLVDLASPLRRRANGVIVLAPGEHGNANSVYATHQIEIQAVNGLAAASDGLLVAAPPTGAEPGGLLADLAGSDLLTEAVSTLNVVDSRSGQLAAAAALAADIAGQPGSYGMRGSTAVLPPALRERG
jgi:copper transport outer membrane protein MctB